MNVPIWHYKCEHSFSTADKLSTNFVSTFYSDPQIDGVSGGEVDMNNFDMGIYCVVGTDENGVHKGCPSGPKEEKDWAIEHEIDKW